MPITLKDGSSTVTTGGTSQQVFPANTARRRLIVQNPPDETEVLAINFTSSASLTSASYLLNPGGDIDLKGQECPTEAINVNAATTGHRFVAKEG